MEPIVPAGLIKTAKAFLSESGWTQGFADFHPVEYATCQ